MPNRILKETICTSPSIEGLNWFEEVCFYRLLVQADDYGRLDARPMILLSRLFPLRDDITCRQITDALVTLEDQDMVYATNAVNAPRRPGRWKIMWKTRPIFPLLHRLNWCVRIRIRKRIRIQIRIRIRIRIRIQADN